MLDGPQVPAGTAGLKRHTVLQWSLPLGLSRLCLTSLVMVAKGLDLAICASCTWTAASASGRGLHSFRWTSYPQGPASRRARCRLPGEFLRLLRQIARVGPEPAVTAPAAPPAQAPQHCSTGWSRPLHADHADLAALESTQRQAARTGRRPGLPPEPQCCPTVPTASSMAWRCSRTALSSTSHPFGR